MEKEKYCSKIFNDIVNNSKIRSYRIVLDYINIRDEILKKEFIKEGRYKLYDHLSSKKDKFYNRIFRILKKRYNN